MTCRLLQRRITKFRYAKKRAHQTLKLFSSGHLAVITITVASVLFVGVVFLWSYPASEGMMMHIGLYSGLTRLCRGKSGPALGGTEYRLMPSACRLTVRAKL